MADASIKRTIQRALDEATATVGAIRDALAHAEHATVDGDAAAEAMYDAWGRARIAGDRCTMALCSGIRLDDTPAAGDRREAK